MPIKRKPNRLKEYDYSQNGAYFITICTKNHRPILGTIVADAALGVPNIRLSKYGEIVRDLIQTIPISNPNVSVQHFIIMPNHIHMIIVIDVQMNDLQASEKHTYRTPRAAFATIPVVVNALKGLSSKGAGFSLWQRSFHDHIIRNDADYNRIAEYIQNNPARWKEDRYYNN